jgi:hypothetical protein
MAKRKRLPFPIKMCAPAEPATAAERASRDCELASQKTVNPVFSTVTVSCQNQVRDGCH